MKKSKKYPLLSCMLIFVICLGARFIEYFYIRTDETILSENFIHKVFGILLLFVILRFCHLSWSDMGFQKEKVLKQMRMGFLLGTACFFIAYLIECLILYVTAGDVHLAFYVTGFSLGHGSKVQSGLIFVFLCIFFNLINVWMEEGLFRGFFPLILSEKSFRYGMMVSALLFGLWHLVMPLRDYLEGNSSTANLILMGMGYMILSAVMSIKWSLLYRLTGSLWMGFADHFFNNAIVTNLLHVVSMGEADSLQIVRIIIGQFVSFLLVLIYARKHKAL